MQSSGRKLSSHVPQASPHGLFLLSFFTRNGNKASMGPIYLPVRHQSAYVKSSRLFNAILRSYIVITIPYSRMKTSEKNPTDFVLGVLPGVAGGVQISMCPHVIKDSFTNIDVSTRDRRQLQNK